ncbi:hypothetical protein [Streptomyces sp. PU-14G]|uniref:hypothetical protein n=1 Tax=Streptomyces sp. PU-14G TaxID=2800808 RepID=UPI0034DFFEAD
MDDEPVKLHDYTEAFKVKRALRKIGKAHVPLKEGLFVDDIKIFGISLVGWVLAYTVLLAPPIRFVVHLVGLGMPVGIPYLFILFVPPVVAVAMSRRPVRYNLALFGLLRGLVRDWLDDPVHRKGVPCKRLRGQQSYRVIVWRPRPDLLPSLAPQEPLPNGLAGPQASGEAGSRPVAGPGTLRESEPEVVETADDAVSMIKAGAATVALEQEPAEEYVMSTRRS